MKYQKTRIVLPIFFAILLVSLIAGISYHVFPSQKSLSKGEILHSSPLIEARLSQNIETNETLRLNVTQGETIKINIILISLSKYKEFTIPFYFSAVSNENQPFTKMVTSPPLPYPALPWCCYDNPPIELKPCKATFDPNPLLLKPGERKITELTISALKDAKLGAYTMFVLLGNWKQSCLGRVTFQLKITSN